ncbi:hypothetical protein [Haladaptatus sp. NG-SE-30]
MSDDTTAAEREGAEREASNDGGRSGLRTLLLMGLSFIAGFLLGKSRGDPNLRKELEDLSTDEGPMEIEISDTGSSSENEDENSGEDEEDEEE